MYKRLAVAIFFAAGVLSYGLPQSALNTFLSTTGIRRANVSLLIKRTSNSETVIDYRSKNCGTPASTTKIVTTATALEMLSPDFKFETVLQYDGRITSGTLKGNIYILGGLDPTLGSKHMGEKDFLEKWLLSIKGLGINRIEGDIIADESLINARGVCPKWTWEDMGNYYGSGTYALSAYDNTCHVYFKTGAPGTTAEFVRVSPEVEGLTINSCAKSANVKSDNSYFYGAPLSLSRTLYGTLPANRQEFDVKADLPNPPLYLAQALLKRLESNGVTVAGTAKVMDKKPQGTSMRTSFYVIESPQLSDIVYNVNHISNNHYAEHIYRYLGSKSTANSDVYDGAYKIKSFWKERGLNTNGLVQYDGCGLSPMNAISADFLVSLLMYEKNEGKYFNEFYESLPIAGMEGTVKKLLCGTKLAGKVRAKSGSISGTQAYAGYIEWKGETYAFAVIVNNFSGARSAVVKAIENLLLSVAS